MWVAEKRKHVCSGTIDCGHSSSTDVHSNACFFSRLSPLQKVVYLGLVFLLMINLSFADPECKKKNARCDKPAGVNKCCHPLVCLEHPPSGNHKCGPCVETGSNCASDDNCCPPNDCVTGICKSAVCTNPSLTGNEQTGVCCANCPSGLNTCAGGNEANGPFCVYRSPFSFPGNLPSPNNGVCVQNFDLNGVCVSDADCNADEICLNSCSGFTCVPKSSLVY